eukprot:gnl/MRDRNA2_/MRDRNA2_106855_c0_seq1.p1 gnl/MRDRNA2_/MRDRNA2_106855_c0~~gnl/MRDRNA2_/MRDRNA2_106855_c0_seq1.p1  ORF type:complete len:385 (+),score=71.31 gnl/MRDRNA2_/MRDRNA2_106855_c0_seq1:80-1234(+)
MAMELRVCNIGGPLCTIGADSHWKVCDVYEAVEAATEIPRDEQRLFFFGEELHGSDALSTILIQCTDSQVVEIILIRKQAPFVRLDGFSVQGTIIHAGIMTIIEAKAMKMKTARVVEDCSGESAQSETMPSCFTFEWKRMAQLTMHEPTSIVFHESISSFSFENLQASDDASLVPHVYLRLQSEGDRSIFMKAVAKSETALENVSYALRADPAFMKQAVKANVRALLYAMDDSLEDSATIIEAVQRDWTALTMVPSKLRDCKDIVLAAVRACGHSLCYASDSLRADREVVLCAVRQNGHALRCAADQLRSDFEIVLAAVRQNGHALQFATEELRMDAIILNAATSQAGESVLRYMPRASGKKARTTQSMVNRLWKFFQSGALYA